MIWRIGEEERRTAEGFTRMFAMELTRLGLGRCRLEPSLTSKEAGWESSFAETFHQMGTTRMASDPRRGVVDADCKVHGAANLYIAGSSVFPTVGYANPTLTIIALALRLADRLKRTLT
jgi:choline dehydrogenase-like flavoprotein